MSFQSPKYTQVPNDLFDIHMKEMGASELKVVMAITRQTIGYHKTKTEYSIRKLMEMTGLSRNSVKSGAKEAEKRGLIKRINKNSKDSARWSLKIERSKFDPPPNGQNLTHERSKFDPPMVNICPTVPMLKKALKKDLKKREEEEGKTYTFFEENIEPLTPHTSELLGELMDEHTPHWVIESMKIAVKDQARKINYFAAILKRWKKDGYGSKKKENYDKNKPKAKKQLYQKSLPDAGTLAAAAKINART